MATLVEMYALRSCLIALPQSVQDAIAKLRRSPMAFKPFHKPSRRPKPVDNWREKLLVDMVRKVREREDPEYSEIFAIFNKITKSSLEKLSGQAVEYMKKRDETFRMRVSTLLFDKAITNHSFASVMADCSLILSKSFPELVDDLETQVMMFDTLYNMNETITCTNDTLIEWTKQKERRRGYAKFVMELNIRGLIPEDSVQKGLADMLMELTTLLSQSKSEQNNENIHQCAVFLYETGKLIPKTSISSRGLLKDGIQKVLNSSLISVVPMKTKFKLEDALKLVS
jgi:hypothetical protein